MSRREQLIPLLFIPLLITGLTFTSCRTPAPPVESKSEPVTVADTVSKLVSKPQESTADSLECRLMVNFISTGGGINSQARLDLERFQMNFAMEQKLPVQPRRIPRGREGEVEYCYPLYGFSEEQAALFVAGMKEVLKNKPLVIISENKKQALH